MEGASHGQAEEFGFYPETMKDDTNMNKGGSGVRVKL